MTTKNITGLSEAPQSVQLAVDLIQLLEDNQIQAEVAVDALKIVINDFEKKRNSSKTELSVEDGANTFIADL